MPQGVAVTGLPCPAARVQRDKQERKGTSHVWNGCLVVNTSPKAARNPIQLGVLAPGMN